MRVQARAVALGARLTLRHTITLDKGISSSGSVVIGHVVELALIRLSLHRSHARGVRLGLLGGVPGVANDILSASRICSRSVPAFCVICETVVWPAGDAVYEGEPIHFKELGRAAGQKGLMPVHAIKWYGQALYNDEIAVSNKGLRSKLFRRIPTRHGTLVFSWRCDSPGKWEALVNSMSHDVRLSAFLMPF